MIPLLYDYVTNIFYPWLNEHNTEFPVVSVVNGHTSHMTTPLSDICLEKKLN